MTETPAEGPRGTGPRLTRRQLLAGIVGTGALVVTSELVPGSGPLAGLAAALSQGQPGGSFTVSFDFVSGDAVVNGTTILPGSVDVTITIVAFLNGVAMPPGGNAAVRTVTTTTASDGSFSATPTFGGATNDNANQFEISIVAGPAPDGTVLSGGLTTPAPPVGPAGPAGATGPIGSSGAPGPTGPVGGAGPTGAERVRARYLVQRPPDGTGRVRPGRGARPDGSRRPGRPHGRGRRRRADGPERARRSDGCHRPTGQSGIISLGAAAGRLGRRYRCGPARRDRPARRAPRSWRTVSSDRRSPRPACCLPVRPAPPARSDRWGQIGAAGPTGPTGSTGPIGATGSGGPVAITGAPSADATAADVFFAGVFDGVLIAEPGSTSGPTAEFTG